MGVNLSFIKKNGRTGFRSNRRYNAPKTYSSFSSNKSRPKGNTENLFYKYIKMAKEASSAGDRIQAEYYYQFADHYSRNMNDVNSKIIVNCSQCLRGSVQQGKYENSSELKRIGVISAGDMTTETSITKLMYLRGRELKIDEIKTLFKLSLRGEITV